jgi:hypothetical protein
MANNIAMNITSKIVALSSAVAFALQIALALLMLRYFSPEEVGVFSVISQIGFFWTTLALAQTPLRLLANHGASVFDDARHAWVSSLQRFVWLSPVAALAVWWSGLSFVNALLWALLLSLFQLTWMLAQSMRLRMVGVWAQTGVRVLPPLMALLVAVVAVFMQWSGPALLAAALLGYAVGAAWLLPALPAFWQGNFKNVLSKSYQNALLPAFQNPTNSIDVSISGDIRSDTLRFAHAFADALLATAIVVVWQRMYGAQETGWMTAPLRVMGFVPALVHIAWIQVQLAQPSNKLFNPLWLGIGAISMVAILGGSCVIFLEFGLLGEHWQGVFPYLLPLALWQGSACLLAAYSHLPFIFNKSISYSYFCISFVFLQLLCLLIPIIFLSEKSPNIHIYLLSIISSIGLIYISINLFKYSKK